MATRLSLLPLCNRNFSRALDHNGSGLVAFGVRSCIYIVDLKTSPPLVLDGMVLRNSHSSGKVLSVSFCKCKGNELLASLGEDGNVKIWDLTTSSCIASQDVKEVAQAVEWLYDSTNSVVFADSHGSVIKWNFNSKNSVRMKTSSESAAYVLSSNKYCPELLAVGHAIGSISILNVNSQMLLHRLKTHSAEITCFSWSPVSPSMLLSVSADQSARLWKLGEDKPIKTYYYPSSKNKGDDKRKAKPFGMCHPKNADIIICTNVRGDIGSVTFKENASPKFCTFIERDFDPSFKTTYLIMSFNIENDDRQMALSVDFNKLSLWEVSDGRLLSSYYFNVGNIHDLSLSTNHPNLIAICPGDGFLKIWNSACEGNDITNIYVNFRAKIMSVAWHPTEGNIVAYGSDEGRVGIIDINKRKVLYSYETHHSGAVYSLQWGPCNKVNDSKDGYFLYSCGAFSIYIYELHKAKEKPLEFDSIITLPQDFDAEQKRYTELCWKSDYTCLAVGNGKGYVQLFDNKLCLLAHFSLQMKNIESIKWHPICTFASPNGSNYKSWLAAAGNDDNIHIFDVADSTKGSSELVLCQSVRTLIGHKKKVSRVCWSPHNDGYLASASRDGTVRVWNVITNTCLAIYPCHRDLVYCVQWSYYDPDVIYSGGQDNCLRIWKISEQSSESAISEKFSLVKYKNFKPKGKYSGGNKSKQEATSLPKEMPEAKADMKNTTKESEKASITAEEVQVNGEKGTARDFFLRDFSKPVKSIFPQIYTKINKKEESLNDIFKLIDLLSEPSDSNSECTNCIVGKLSEEETLTYGFYTDEMTALKMLETQGWCALFY